MEQRKRTEWLRSTPAVIAGVLATVYALGAVAVYGQMKGAGLDAVQTMPLVPIEQILGRGIGSIASIFTRAFVNALLGILIVVGLWSERDQRGVAHPRDWSRRLYLGMPAAAVLFAIVSPWETAAVLVIGITTMVGVWALGGVAGVRGWKALIIIASGSVASVLPMSIAASLLEPQPLPMVSIVRSSGSTIHGGLVAETGTNWYVAHPDHSVQAIPNGEVERAVVTYPKREHDPSLIELIF